MIGGMAAHNTVILSLNPSACLAAAASGKSAYCSRSTPLGAITGVATINGSGLASSVAPGTTTITATSGSIAGSTILMVTSATLKSIAADQRSTCDKFSDHDTFSGLENDYPTSVRLFICYQNKLTKKGQLTLVKTIKGDSHFFVITRAKRVSTSRRLPLAGVAFVVLSM